MTEISHRDILGNTISAGDTVVYPSHNSLKIASVKKVNPKMISVIAVGSSWAERKYPNDLLVADDPKITLYMLKNNN